MKAWLNLIFRKPKTSIAIVIVIGISIFGVNYFLRSHASTPFVSEEAETGSLSGEAVTHSPDSSASNNAYVEFGKGPTFCQPTQLPTTTLDTSLDSTISGQLGPGWIGGDATYSTLLPDGQEAFVFSDTIIGTAKTNGTSTISGFIHNSELVGKLPNLSSDYPGSYTSPSTLINDTNGGGATWQIDSTDVENGQQLIFINEFEPTSDSNFGKFAGNSAIAIMKLHINGLPTFSSIQTIPSDANTQWGVATTSDSTYRYIYGEASSSSMKLARVPLNKTLITSDWQYWNGTTWVNNETSAIEIQTTNVLDGVTQSNSGGYIAISIPANIYFEQSLQVSYACSPQGPWSEPQTIYTIPEDTEYSNELSYIPTFHPELSGSNILVTSYNVDNLDGLTPLMQNIHQFQPRFVYLTEN